MAQPTKLESGLETTKRGGRGEGRRGEDGVYKGSSHPTSREFLALRVSRLTSLRAFPSFDCLVL